jgi:Uma2 family endonuclease
LTVARGGRHDYRSHHPAASDVALVIEVSDSTLTTDRLKGRVYARAGIAQYWIVNLGESSIEVYTQPQPDAGYSSCQVFRAGDELRLVIDGQACGGLAVSALLA